MTRTRIARFNVKNLIEAEHEYDRLEEYAWKRAWLADQLLTINADVVCFQETLSENALRDVITETDELGPAQWGHCDPLYGHLTDASYSERPYSKLASDHGQVVAHMVLGDPDV